MRDIEGDYRQALLDEYAAYRRAGRDGDAKHVAEVLREQYGHEVEPKPARPREEQAAPERADAQRPPEDTAEPKPTRPVAKKTAAKKPVPPADR